MIAIIGRITISEFCGAVSVSRRFILPAAFQQQTHQRWIP
jgi:hypothetical protein